MDPHLPAPKAGEEYQLIPMTQLIPEDLQGIYKKLVTKASSGDLSVQRNMQHLVWALRTAGTDAAFANNLTPQQKRILDRCSEYPGQFEEFNANAKANSKALKELIGLADSFLNVKIGGVSYKASDLLDPDVGNKKINEHLNQLIGMSQHLPVEKSGFNFGEIQPGIYTDVRGSGHLQYSARIANSTNQPFIYYPTDYIGQVGSLTNGSTMVTSMRQRVTGENPYEFWVYDKKKTVENPELPPFCKLPKSERKKLLKYAYHAKYAYNSRDSNSFDEFKKIRDLAKFSGFEFDIFKDGKDTVIAMRGTDDLEDAYADKKLAFGEKDLQNFWAEKLVREVLDKTNGNVILTGHSLGGYEAAYAAVRVNDNRISGVYTYNSPGFRKPVLARFDKKALDSAKKKIINVNDTADVVHYNGQQIGKSIRVVNSAGFFDDLSQMIPFFLFHSKIVYNHSIETLIKRMESCR